MAWIKLSNQRVNLDRVERVEAVKGTRGRFLRVFIAGSGCVDVLEHADVEKLDSALDDLCADTEESYRPLPLCDAEIHDEKCLRQAGHEGQHESLSYLWGGSVEVTRA